MDKVTLVNSNFWATHTRVSANRISGKIIRGDPQDTTCIVYDMSGYKLDEKNATHIAIGYHNDVILSMGDTDSGGNCHSKKVEMIKDHIENKHIVDRLCKLYGELQVIRRYDSTKLTATVLVARNEVHTTSTSTTFVVISLFNTYELQKVCQVCGRTK